MNPSIIASLTTTDPFAVLGLTRDATPQAIKARYYQLARKYHPNTNHGIDRSPQTHTTYRHAHRRHHHHHHHDVQPAITALSEHFHRIYNAYTTLSRESQRKRYIEWAILEEQDDAVDARRLEVEYIDYGSSESDGWSSDLDDFEVASYHRAKREERAAAAAARDDTVAGAQAQNGRRPSRVSRRNGSSSRSGSEDRRGRPSSQAIPDKLPGDEADRADSTQRAAAIRRKKLNRIKRKEIEAFEDYREAKLIELDAQIEAERLKEIYDKTKAKREQIEKIPLETSTRVKMVRNILLATKLLRPSQQQQHQQQQQQQQRQRGTTLGRRPSVQTSFISDDYIVGISSPMSARPGLGSHRRVLSSDISGDQTDSDDETPHPQHRHRRRSPTPSRSPNPTPVALPPQPVPLLAPVQLPTPPQLFQSMFGPAVPLQHDSQVDAQPAPSLGNPDSKFRLFVKRPTGFDDEHEIIEDLTSPVSPAPFVNYCREIIHLPGGAPFDRAIIAETNDIINGATQPQSIDSESDTSPVRPQKIFQIKVIGEQYFADSIPSDHVHRLNISEESRLLGKPLDADTSPKDLLRQIQVWDRQLASRFMVKPDIKAAFAFRLICENGEFVRQPHQSFIALSYRRKTMVKKLDDRYTLPLAAEMLQAVWEERISDSEGLWIDQISIDQDNDRERDISMSAMDLVYRGARLVVVVLDDFQFSPHEAEILAAHMQSYESMKHVAPNKRFRRHNPAWLEAHEDLFNVISKILSASWFKRAWCRHEMRLANEHIFLIPCHSFGSVRKTILRLSSACLAHMLALAAEVALRPEVELIKPALHAFFKDRTESSDQRNKRSHHGNFTTVAAEVFRMEAGGDPRLPLAEREADARWDRMSIILNAMECGLALRPSQNGNRQYLSNAECYYSLLMLALAARDPGALCSAGKPLELPGSPGAGEKGEPGCKPPTSWLFEPTIVDAGLNNYKTLRRLPLGSTIRTGWTGNAHWVRLDLKFVGQDPLAKQENAAGMHEIKQLAIDFINRCEREKWGRWRRFILHDKKANTNFGPMKDIYVQTLTGVFCCGPDWMASVCQRYGVARWKQDLEPAYWLLVHLRSMDGKWPKLERDDWTARAAAFIMNFVNFLIIRGMPQRQLRRPETWRPVWVTLKNRGKVLTFSPDRDDIQPVIPSMLLDAEYRDLARLWILEPRADDDQWTLLGKSVLFSDYLAKEVINCEDEMVQHQQTVYGRAL